MATTTKKPKKVPKKDLLKLEQVVDYITASDCGGDLTKIADGIESLLESIKPVPQVVTNFIKDYVQNYAAKVWYEAGDRGFIAAATGLGKSKIALNLIEMAHRVIGGELKIMIVVPTETLRDNNWKAEFDKWEMSHLYEMVRMECYASIAKIENQSYHLVIFDEAHNLTDNNADFVDNNNNSIAKILALSATPPSKKDKVDVLKRLQIPMRYEVTLDEAVKLRLVAPYEIVVVETHLDSVTQNIEGGTKDRKFMTTEAKTYAYHNMMVDRARFGDKMVMKFKLLARMRFLYNLPSKTKAAEWILDKLPRGNRMLVFCGSIQQATELGDRPEAVRLYLNGQADPSILASDLDMDAVYTYHSKSTKEYLKAFAQGEIERLTCVAALNEGENFEGIDMGLVTSLNSNSKDLVQRIGRLIRYRVDHIAKVYILVCMGTQDEVWAESAMKGLDQSKITRVSFQNLKSGKAFL